VLFRSLSLCLRLCLLFALESFAGARVFIDGYVFGGEGYCCGFAAEHFDRLFVLGDGLIDLDAWIDCGMVRNTYRIHLSTVNKDSGGRRRREIHSWSRL